MVEKAPPLAVEITSSTQIFPEIVQNDPTTVPLSIIDNTVSYFSRCAATWFYDPPEAPGSHPRIPILQQSLSKSLNSYRPWCGRLSYAAVSLVPQ